MNYIPLLTSNIIELISLSKIPNPAILCASTTTAVSSRNVQRLVISYWYSKLIVLIFLG